MWPQRSYLRPVVIKLYKWRGRKKKPLKALTLNKLTLNGIELTYKNKNENGYDWEDINRVDEWDGTVAERGSIAEQLDVSSIFSKKTIIARATRSRKVPRARYESSLVRQYRLLAERRLNKLLLRMKLYRSCLALVDHNFNRAQQQKHLSPFVHRPGFSIYCKLIVYYLWKYQKTCFSRKDCTFIYK